MSEGGGVQVSDVIAAVSLAIAVVLAVREFTARPRLLTWQQSIYAGTERVFAGSVIHVCNVGRAPALLAGIGAKLPGGGTGMIGGEFTFLGNQTQNPTYPLMLMPGERAAATFPVSAYAESTDYQIEVVRLTRWAALTNGSRMTSDKRAVTNLPDPE